MAERTWLEKIFNRKPRVKSRTWTADVAGHGIPLHQNPSLGELVGPAYKGAITPDLAGRIYASTPVVRTCADIIANYGSSVPMRCYYRSSKKNKWQIEEDREPAPMLRFINKKLTPVEYVARLLYFMSLYENAYVAVEPSEKEDTKYSNYSLYPLNLRFVRVIPDAIKGTSYIEYKVGEYAPIYFKTEQVMHIGGFSPFDDFYGLSKLNALEFDINKERIAKQFLTRFYNSAASFSGVLTANGEGEEELQKIRAMVEENYRGGNKAFRILVLEEGQKFETFQSNSIEINTLPIIKDSNEMTQMVFGVPLGLLSGQVSGNDLEAVEELFWNRTVMPMLERIQQMHTKKLCMPINPDKLKISFDTKGVLALKRQKLNLARIHVAYLNSGSMVANEVREELGLDSYSGDNQEFGETAIPVFNAKNQMKAISAKPGGNPGQANGSGPSLSMDGVEGGRDQSSNGEAQMVDSSGKKKIELTEQLGDILKGFNLDI